MSARPTLLHFPGDRVLEKAQHRFGVKPVALATPPAGSDLRPVMGERGLPGIGNSLALIREGEPLALRMREKYGDIFWGRAFGASIVTNESDVETALRAVRDLT